MVRYTETSIDPASVTPPPPPLLPALTLFRDKTTKIDTLLFETQFK